MCSFRQHDVDDDDRSDEDKKMFVRCVCAGEQEDDKEEGVRENTAENPLTKRKLISRGREWMGDGMKKIEECAMRAEGEGNERSVS